MFSALLVLIAVAGAAVTAWTLLAWRRLGSILVLFNAAALASVALTALLAGLGKYIGAGDRLRDLYALPMLIGMAAVPLTLYTFATICRRAGFAWARPDWGHGVVCLAAAALTLWSLGGAFVLKAIEPAVWRDVVWYPPAVPFAPILACVLAAWLGLAAGLWRRERRSWLFVTMCGGIALVLLPPAWGPLPRMLGESLCFSAMAVVAVRYAVAPAAA